MKVVDIILERIIKNLESGNSWVKTWASGIPTNGATGHEYSGINKLLLCNYEIPRFYSFKQVKEMGECVREGSKAIPVVFWKMLNYKDEEGSESTIPLMRYYNVFNEKDTTIKPKETPKVDPDPICESIVNGFSDRPQIEIGEPCYIPSTDKILMRTIADFEGTGEYYATLFHELSHSTGHKKRLDREFGASFGSDKYALEELVAEIASCFLSAKAGIENVVKDNSQSYINGWISRFKEKPNLIISLSSKAEKAYQYILGEKNRLTTA